MVKANYIQGETIAASVATAPSAIAYAFRFWPVRSTALKTAAEQLIASIKTSLTVGEISMTDKRAEEIAALDGLIRARSGGGGGSYPMTVADGANEATADVPSDNLYGEYQYAVFAAGEQGRRTVVASGSFTVEGDPDAADSGTAAGVFSRIYTAF